MPTPAVAAVAAVGKESSGEHRKARYRVTVRRIACVDGTPMTLHPLSESSLAIAVPSRQRHVDAIGPERAHTGTVPPCCPEADQCD
jgi:hypothetical protein